MAKREKSVTEVIDRIQAREDRERARRVDRLKRGIAGADFRDDELRDLEQIVFRAYGRAQLG
jgi:hypothetical protein